MLQYLFSQVFKLQNANNIIQCLSKAKGVLVS